MIKRTKEIIDWKMCRIPPLDCDKGVTSESGTIMFSV